MCIFNLLRSYVLEESNRIYNGNDNTLREPQCGDYLLQYNDPIVSNWKTNVDYIYAFGSGDEYWALFIDNYQNTNKCAVFMTQIVFGMWILLTLSDKFITYDERTNLKEFAKMFRNVKKNGTIPTEYHMSFVLWYPHSSDIDRLKTNSNYGQIHWYSCQRLHFLRKFLF